MKGGRSNAESVKAGSRLAVNKGGQKTKKRKAAKDPNKPKRPPSAFFVFMEGFRVQFKEKNPGNKFVAVIGKAGGDKWRSMSDDEKHIAFEYTIWNVSAGAARPNPQGSFRYGQITVTDVYVILNRPAELIDGKWRATLNGISHLAPSTPLKLAQQFNIPGVYKLDFPYRLMNRPAKVDTSLINGSYRGFMEIILQNGDSTVQSYHLDGYAFFVVGMDYGVWTENSRSIYNKWDGVARSTTQVFPGAWTAILVSLDNVGIWNLRTENLDTWYLGQEVYISVVNPEITEKTELPLPDNTIYCGLLSSLQKDQAHRVKFSGAPSAVKASEIILIVFVTFSGVFMW